MPVIHRKHALDKNADPGEELIGALPPPALTLINTATNADEIKALPGIGTVSANAIFLARPEKGFEALADVQGVEGLPGSIDWDEVRGWEAAL